MKSAEDALKNSKYGQYIPSNVFPSAPPAADDDGSGSGYVPSMPEGGGGGYSSNSSSSYPSVPAGYAVYDPKPYTSTNR